MLRRRNGFKNAAGRTRGCPDYALAMEQRTRLYREVRFEGERESGGWLVLFCVRGGPRARNKFVSKSAFALRVGGTRGKKRAAR